MKHKALKKKMSLNKITISHLDAKQEMVVMGGATGTCPVASVCLICQKTQITCPTDCNTCVHTCTM